MTDAAASLLDRYGKTIEGRATARPELDKWFARLIEVVPKLALLAAAAETSVRITFSPADQDEELKWDPKVQTPNNAISDLNGEISEADMAYAIWFLERLIPGTAELLSQLGMTRDQQLTNRILAAIEGAGPGGVLRSRLMDNRNLTPRQMNDVADALESRGRIRIDRTGKTTVYVALD